MNAHDQRQASPKLLDQVREACRLRHLSLRTEQAYVRWIKRFVLFHGKQHPATLDERHVRAFLTHLAVARHVAASTQSGTVFNPTDADAPACFHPTKRPLPRPLP